MDDDSDELVFTQDNVINLDEFGEMEDYEQLVAQALNMVTKSRVDPGILARIQDSELDYLLNERQAPLLLDLLLDKIEIYWQHKLLIAGILFQALEGYMMADSIQEKTATHFLAVLRNLLLNSKYHLNSEQRFVLLNLLLVFLKRLSTRLVYIDEEAKLCMAVRYFQIMVSCIDTILQKVENQKSCKASSEYIQIVEKFLRHKQLRQQLSSLAESSKLSHLDSLKYFGWKWNSYEGSLHSQTPNLENLVLAQSIKNYLHAQAI